MGEPSTADVHRPPTLVTNTCSLWTSRREPSRHGMEDGEGFLEQNLVGKRKVMRLAGPPQVSLGLLRSTLRI